MNWEGFERTWSGAIEVPYRQMRGVTEENREKRYTTWYYKRFLSHELVLVEFGFLKGKGKTEVKVSVCPSTKI
jgi:hypothetical protein